MTSATLSPATWRSRDCSDDLADHRHHPYSGTGGEDVAVCGAVDEPGAQQSAHGHDGFVRFDLAPDVLDRPDRLAVLGVSR